MSINGKIFDGCLLFGSINFFTQKPSIWKNRLVFILYKILGWSPKRWSLSLVNPAFSPCEQGPSAIRTAFAAAHKRYLARLVDHPGWFGVNWLWYFIGLFGGPQMQILGGSIIRWTFSCDFTFISVIQVLPDSGHTGEGSWVNVNLLDNPSWPSNPGGMKLSTPRYSTFPP